MTEPIKAISQIPSRQLFAPYFKARWQNMQNIVNDSIFYSMIGPNYISYYQAYIKQWLQWASGFVPSLHQKDFFSCGMGYTICDIFTRECMSGGFRFDSVNQRLSDFIEEWGESDLNNVFNKMFFFANAGGNAVLCLTPIKGKLYPSAIPINRIIFEIGRHGEISQAMILNRFIGGGKVVYYAREQRIMYKGRPYYKVDLAEGDGTAVSPSWNSCNIDHIPEIIENAWECAYGEISPGIWYEMPKSFCSLGLYNVRNKSVAVALSDMPGYSDSTLHTALDLLYSLDYNYTQSQIDQYFSKTRVIIPKTFNKISISTNQMSGAVRVGDGLSFTEAIQSQPLYDDIYSETPMSGGVNGEPIKPFFIQPDLRAEAHKFIRDSDLELLSSKVGLSSSTLANHLTYNNSKTATEVRSEQDTTETSVNNKRALANKAINAMLKEVAAYNGFTDEVAISWNRAGISTSSENASLLADFQAGTLPLEQYLKKRWRDLSEDEAKQWISDLNAQSTVSDIFDPNKALLGR